MIGSSRQRETIQALQNEAAAWQAQAKAFDDRLAALSLQLSVQQEQSATSAAEAARLRQRIAELDETVAAQAQALGSQAEALRLHAREIESLREAAERWEEQVRQARADLIRLERQAAIDVDEMRRTSAAVAASILLKPSPDGVPGHP